MVGWAETPVQDSTCVDAQVLQFRAVVWDPKDGSKDKIKTRALPPCPATLHLAPPRRSTTTARWSASPAIATRASAASAPVNAVLWDKNGKPTEIPNLGGTTWHTPMDINDQGDVVGFSNPPGAGDPEGDFISRAFCWI